MDMVEVDYRRRFYEARKAYDRISSGADAKYLYLGYEDYTELLSTPLCMLVEVRKDKRYYNGLEIIQVAVARHFNITGSI